MSQSNFPPQLKKVLDLVNKLTQVTLTWRKAHELAVLDLQVYGSIVKEDGTLYYLVESELAPPIPEPHRVDLDFPSEALIDLTCPLPFGLMLATSGIRESGDKKPPQLLSDSPTKAFSKHYNAP